MIDRRLAARVGGALVACLLTLPASALATEVSGDGALLVLGDAGADHITLATEGAFLVISEEGGNVGNASPDCAQHPTASDKVRCAHAGVDSVDVDGAGGNDILDDDQATEIVSLLGGADDDTLNSGTDSGDSTLIGGAGNDTLNARNGRINPTDEGGIGDDTFNGSPTLNDAFEAEAGIDTFNGGEPSAPSNPYCNLDPEICSEPRDRVSYAAVGSNAVQVTLDGVANDGLAAEPDNVAADIEEVVGGDGGDRIDASGAGGVHRFSGGGGDDILIGGPGDDDLELGPGADTGDGLAGDDHISDGDEESAPSADRLLGGSGDDSLTRNFGADEVAGGDGYDSTGLFRFDAGTGLPRDVEITLDDVANDGVKGAGETVNYRGDIEDVTVGPGNDRVIGSGGPNVISTGFGNDVVDGGAGVDQIFAGHGIDSIVSRDGGFDLVNCGGGADPEVQADASDRLDHCELRADAPVPPPADTTRPVARILSRATVAGETFRRNRGLKVVFDSDEEVVVQGGATASRARIARVGDVVVGEGKLGLGTGRRTIRIRFGRTYVAAIARKLRRKSYRVAVRLTALDKAGNGAEMKQVVTIKRLKRRR